MSSPEVQHNRPGCGLDRRLRPAARHATTRSRDGFASSARIAKYPIASKGHETGGYLRKGVVMRVASVLSIVSGLFVCGCTSTYHPTTYNPPPVYGGEVISSGPYGATMVLP